MKINCLYNTVTDVTDKMHFSKLSVKKNEIQIIAKGFKISYNICGICNHYSKYQCLSRL